MRALLLIGAGGFVGSVSRYLVSGWVHRGTGTFPWGTLTVNLGGCLLIGLLAGLAETRQLLTGEVRMAVLVGVLGGFTTFSSFGYETFALLRDAEGVRAALNVTLQLAGGLLAVWLGDRLAQLF